ncbi:hypothetical protein GOB19_27500 [Sinorhizobium meliloti]|nr:hypothetical protein [Sinorhizobium meliloti]MDX0016731.1 hypothetical protein [Sinorhizobium meliloti]MDX0163265.1 hypothetical protein [Sinorhizobium meliloti]
MTDRSQGGLPEETIPPQSSIRRSPFNPPLCVDAPESWQQCEDRDRGTYRCGKEAAFAVLLRQEQ